jgi:hypothetical protein
MLLDNVVLTELLESQGAKSTAGCISRFAQFGFP